MKLILLTLALAAIAVTHCNATGGFGMPCIKMHGTRASGTLKPADGDTVGDCNVMLEADSGPRLQITLTSIDLEYTSDQTLFDYYRDEYNEDYEAIYLDRPQFQSTTDLNITCHQWIEVRDGPAQFSPLLGEYCGNKELLSLPITLQTSGKYAFVRFYKKVRESEAAFQLEYHPVGSDTICMGPGPRSGCNVDEVCAYDGIQDKDVVFKCARKVALGEYCEDDSWCSGGNGICRGKRCVNKLASGETGCKDDSWCQNGDDDHPGVCADGTCRIWKNRHDCCNPNEVDHGCDPTTDYSTEESLECNNYMWQCQPSMIYGDYDEAMRKERCMAELLG